MNINNIYKILIDMKNLMMGVMMFLTCTTTSLAQGFKEPEYIGEVSLVQSDNRQVILEKEEAEMKTKTSGFGYIPIPGSSLLDKGKTFLRVKGESSPNKVAKGKVQFVVRVKDHNEDPKTTIGVFQFEAKKKERRFMLAEVGVLSGLKATTSFNTVAYEVEKFGESSFLVTISDAAPGEYGVTTTDFGHISTFSVK